MENNLIGYSKIEHNKKELCLGLKVEYNEIQEEINSSEDIWMRIMNKESKRRSEKMRYGFFNPSYCKQSGYLTEIDLELTNKLNENKEAVLESAIRN